MSDHLSPSDVQEELANLDQLQVFFPGDAEIPWAVSNLPQDANKEEGLWLDKGDMTLTIPDTPFSTSKFSTKFSPENEFYHVMSGPRGRMRVELAIKGILDMPTTTYVRYNVIRENYSYSQFPVDKVCDTHCNVLKDNYVKNILRPIEGPYTDPAYLTQGIIPSLVYQVEAAPGGSTLLHHEMFFTCNDSCVNSTQHQQMGGGKQMKHAARDLRLVVTHETWDGEVLARRSALVWPKSDVNQRDLEKKERRCLQGGAAQKAAKRRRENMEEAQVENTTTQASVTTQEAETSVSETIDQENGTFITEREFSFLEAAINNPDRTTEMVLKAIRKRLSPPAQ